MLFYKNFRNSKFYRKLFISYFIIVFTNVMFISSLLFQIFSTSAASESNRISQEMLTQASVSSDVIYEQMVTCANQLLNDNDIITTMFSETYDPIREYNALRKFSNIQAIYSFISYFCKCDNSFIKAIPEGI